MEVLTIYLAFLYLAAVYFADGWGFWLSELMRFLFLAAGFLAPQIVGFMVWKNKPQILNLLITLFILALLADREMSLLAALVLGLVTALVKTVARTQLQPIFNPAAAGLVAASFLGAATTWWGVSFSPRLPVFNMSVAMLLTLPVGLYIIWHYKKLPTLVGVAGAFGLVYWLLSGRSPATILLEGTFAFFLLFMATEPRTSPVVDWQEWIYGSILGGALGFLFVIRLVSEPYLYSLLTLNLAFAAFRFVQLKLAVRG